MKGHVSFSFFLLFAHVVCAQVSDRLLRDGWQFRRKGEATWKQATVPGTVHADLLRNKLIPDPYFGDNEKKVQWVEDETWEYRLVFRCNKVRGSHNLLVFDGLDTYAQVRLNDSLILRADNMFRKWEVDVGPFLKQGRNKLLVTFEPAARKAKEAAGKIDYILPSDERVFTRKAQFQYGWDFAPRLVTCGLWKPVHLLTWKHARIAYVAIAQEKLTDAEASLRFDVDLTSDSKRKIWIEVNKTRVYFTLNEGSSKATIAYRIQNPGRWSRENPFLYNFKVRLCGASGLLDQRTVRTGLRTIDLVTNPDSVGSSFYFTVNGVPVFMKGANCVPVDALLRSKEQKALVRMAADANMNMVRVWGGGFYAGEDFLNACDEAGILVWHDFMFACAMYPGDSVFLQNVEEEVRQQVRRMRNHPCIALWCGNNEVDEGWKNWGWQKQFNMPEADSAKVYKDYRKLFHEIIPRIIKQEDPERPYWPSSPLNGWGRKESLTEGDLHYWGVWWGMEEFARYREKVGRFVSEYGFQSLPQVSLLKKYADSLSEGLSASSLRNHQKHPRGFETVSTYMKAEFGFVPTDVNSYTYLSQVLQAKGMQTAIEAHRGAKPYCMGTLYWQLNDCWPAVSWSSIDYRLQPKAFYYQAKRSYQDVIIKMDEQENGESHVCKVRLLSDKTEMVTGVFFVKLISLDGKVVHRSESAAVSVSANGSVGTFEYAELAAAFPNTFLCCYFRDDKTKQVISAAYFVNYHMWQHRGLKKPKLRITGRTASAFTVTTDRPARYVHIYTDREDLRLSDNYFDLMPGEDKVIYFKSGKPLHGKLRIESLYDHLDRN